MAAKRKRKVKRRPAHRAALDLPWEHYLALNHGINLCAICGAAPKKRRLHRDHAHSGKGIARGLLCARCNKHLPNWCTSDWLRKAAAYLDERQASGTTNAYERTGYEARV